MSRWWPVLLARSVRVIRVRPGDTLLVTHPGTLTTTAAEQLRRDLEDALGLRHDVRIVITDATVELTVTREV